MKKLMKAMVLVFALALFLVGCGNDTKTTGTTTTSTTESTDSGKAPEGDTIKIGGLAPLTGDVSIYGITANNAAKMAFEEINTAGGILGKEVEYIVYDEKGDQTEAVTAFDKLLQDGVVAVIGDITSKPTLAVAEASQETGIPMITPTGTQADITLIGPNVFRVCFTDPYQGKVMATFAADNLKAKTAAILTNTSSDYSDGIAKAFKETAVEKGIEIVAEEGYADADMDFKSQLTTIAQVKPDVILVPDYYQKDALIAQQAREVGLESTFLGVDGWDGISATLDASNYGIIENSYFSNHYSVKDESEKVQSFITNYKAKYNEDPSAFSALAYDAAYLMAKAIEEAGSTDYEAVTKAIQNIKFDGVTGALTFDENGDPIKAVSIIKIVNGEYTLDSKVEAN